MSNSYVRTIDAIMVTLTELRSDVEEVTQRLLKENNELVDENRLLKEKLREQDST